MCQAFLATAPEFKGLAFTPFRGTIMMRARAMIAMLKTAGKLPIPAIDLRVDCRPFQLALTGQQESSRHGFGDVAKMLYAP